MGCGMWPVKFGSPVAHGECWKMSDTSERDCKRRVSDLQRHCSLCKECLRDAHSHPAKWKSELQQFLLTYSTQRYQWAREYASPVKRGWGGDWMANSKDNLFLDGLSMGQKKKQNQYCCVPGCGKPQNIGVCLLVFNIVCEAGNVNAFPLCSQNHYMT